MPYLMISWAKGTLEKISQRGLTQAEVERVAMYPAKRVTSRSSNRPMAVGWNDAGERIGVVYEHLDRDWIVIVTAFRMD
jgi:uncharacterized DUF497 family protein